MKTKLLYASTLAFLSASMCLTSCVVDEEIPDSKYKETFYVSFYNEEEGETADEFEQIKIIYKSELKLLHDDWCDSVVISGVDSLTCVKDFINRAKKAEAKANNLEMKGMTAIQALNGQGQMVYLMACCEHESGLKLKAKNVCDKAIALDDARQIGKYACYMTLTDYPVKPDRGCYLLSTNFNECASGRPLYMVINGGGIGIDELIYDAVVLIQDKGKEAPQSFEMDGATYHAASAYHCSSLSHDPLYIDGGNFNHGTKSNKDLLLYYAKSSNPTRALMAEELRACYNYDFILGWSFFQHSHNNSKLSDFPVAATFDRSQYDVEFIKGVKEENGIYSLCEEEGVNLNLGNISGQQIHLMLVYEKFQ